MNVTFADSGKRTQAASVASEGCNHYAIATRTKLQNVFSNVFVVVLACHKLVLDGLINEFKLFHTARSAIN